MALTTDNTEAVVDGLSAANRLENRVSTLPKCVSNSSFQEEFRQWFITLSPEDRVTALAYKDESWMTLWIHLVATTRAASSSLSPGAISTPFSSGAPEKSAVGCDECGGLEEGNPASPHRTTDRFGKCGQGSSFDRASRRVRRRVLGPYQLNR
jgi:hypothetical protein